MSAAPIGDLLGWKIDAIASGKRITRTPRRESYDENSRQADIFRPICGGNRNEALRWCDKLLQTAREYNTLHKKKGEREGPLGSNGLWVLEVLLGFVDFATGRCDPAIDTLCNEAKLARDTVNKALERLNDHGFIKKVRRTRKTGRARNEGPQREQITSAYAFATNLAAKVAARFKQLFGGRRAAQALQEKKCKEAEERAALLSMPTAGLGTALFPNDRALAAKLNAIGAKLDSPTASSVSREYPELDLKGEKE